MSTTNSLQLTLKELLDDDEDDLLEKIGLGVTANISQQPRVVEYALKVPYTARAVVPMEDLRAIGRRVLVRWNREFYNLMCGEGAVDQTDRESLIKAFGVGDVAFAAALTGLLIAWGVGAGVAAVIAALVVKRVLSPAAEMTLGVICEEWGKKLTEE